MKSVFYGILALTLSQAAFAQTPNPGLSDKQAEAKVIAIAHTYISKNAPDYGGEVHSPCLTDLNGDAYTITCKGFARTTFDDGSRNQLFKCIGDFTKGMDGLFYKNGSIHCE